MVSFVGSQQRPRARLEIIPDSEFVFFHGDGEDSESADLSGTLALDTSEHMNVRSIRIRFEGRRKISWFVDPQHSQLQMKDKDDIINEEVRLFPRPGVGSGEVHKIRPGEHSFRFNFKLNPVLPESIEGLTNTYIVYQLVAVVERGYITKNIETTKHIRVIRTLGRDMMNTLNTMPMEQCNEDVWPDKVVYKITTPTIYHIYGTSITANFTLTPIRKGVTIGKVKMEVLENIQLQIPKGNFKSHVTENVVASIESKMPEDQSPMALVSEETGETLYDESHNFKMTLPLERSLTKCRQSVSTEHIKIIHHLKLFVSLINPDGHTSQLVVKNRLYLFISPSLPVGSNNSITAPQDHIASIMRSHTDPEAPPTYEQRHQDQQLEHFYQDVDASGYLTPRRSMYVGAGNTGSNTPANGSLSRTGSDEELSAAMVSAALDDSDPDTAAATESGASATQLHSRLATLEQRRANGDARAPQAIPSRGSSAPGTPYFVPTTATVNHVSNGHSANHSRRSSQEEGYFPSRGPQRAQGSADRSEAYDMEALSKIPSYNTAIRTPLGVSPSKQGLPSYYDSASASAAAGWLGRVEESPPRVGQMDRASVPVLPERAHVRSEGRSPRLQ